MAKAAVQQKVRSHIHTSSRICQGCTYINKCDDYDSELFSWPKKTMKHIPNILSVSRIALCLPLLLVDAMTVPFWTLYLIAGLTDMLDGFLARRWGVESKFGARLDSVADFVFVLVVGYKLFPWLKLPAALWMMIGLIVMVKIVNAVSSYVVKHSQFLHTKANKLTGFLLFIGMMTIGQSYFIPATWMIACFALFAAIQEGHLIRSR